MTEDGEVYDSKLSSHGNLLQGIIALISSYIYLALQGGKYLKSGK
jgi:hypothetical protein